MILFKSDYQRHHGFIIDVDTPNKSFVRYSALLRSMGIENHTFMLVLLNPELKGVNPFSPILTIEQMAMIAIEITQNPWYFFRECARAPGLGSNESLPFEANRGNIALYWCFFNHIMTMLIQVRQTGKSFSVDVLVTLLMNVLCQNTQINLLTKDDILRRRNIERLKEISLEIPRFLQQHSRDDANNGEELTVRRLGNTFITHVPQSSPKRAYNLGRGLTSAIFFIDEPPFQPNISISLPAALAATGAAVDAAKKTGTPYGTVLTTTAGKKDDRDGRFVYNLMADSAEWTEKFFDAENLEELESMIKRNSRSGVVRVNITLSHRQLGKTDEWLKQKLDESLQTGEDAERDFFNMWSSGSQTNPLPVHILERIAKSKKDVLYTDISKPSGYITKWYIPEEEIYERLKNGKFVMGMDTSDASGGDDISLVLMDVETLEVIAAGTYNETNLISFSEWVCSILVSNPNITAIIERRSTGGMLLDYLLLMLPQHGIDPFQRLFNRVVNEYDENKDRYNEIKVPMGRRSSDIYVRYKKTFGFATSATGYASRSEIYSTTLQNAAKRSCDKVNDKFLIDQITGLINKNGRIDHEDGENDDLCFIGSTLVRTIYGNRPIKDLKLGDLVLTRKGYKPIIKLFCSKKEVITKYGLTGTSNHPFITPSGEIQFKDIKLETEVYVWNEKLSIIEVKTIIDTLNLIETNTEIISTDMTNGMSHQLPYIDKSMKTQTDQYQKDAKSTIKTKTFPITVSTTLNVSLLQSIANFTQCLKKLAFVQQKEVRKTILLESGEKTIQNSLVNKLLKMAVNLKELIIGEKKILNLQNKFTQRLVKKEQKQKSRKKEIVYNIMVEDCHEYFVNDILVHNCIGWLLCHWLLSHGKNLSHYGIDTAKVMSRIVAKKQESSEDTYNRLEQDRVRERIKDVFDSLSKEQDDYVSLRLESELRALDKQIILDEGEIYNLDSLITQARDAKRNKKRNYDFSSKNYNYRNEYSNSYNTANSSSFSDKPLTTNEVFGRN